MEGGVSKGKVCMGAYLGGRRLPPVRPLTYTLAVVIFLATVVAIIGRFATAVVAEVLHVAVNAPCTLVLSHLRGCWALQSSNSCTLSWLGAYLRCRLMSMMWVRGKGRTKCIWTMREGLEYLCGRQLHRRPRSACRDARRRPGA